MTRQQKPDRRRAEHRRIPPAPKEKAARLITIAWSCKSCHQSGTMEMARQITAVNAITQMQERHYLISQRCGNTTIAIPKWVPVPNTYSGATITVEFTEPPSTTGDW